MSEEEDDNGVVAPDNVEKTTQLQEKEGQSEKENVEVGEGQELEVLPKKKREHVNSVKKQAEVIKQLQSKIKQSQKLLGQIQKRLQKIR